jgi:hypothetical protein
MSRLEIIHDAGSSLLRSKRIWLIQFVANPLLFAGFVAWLFLPVATDFHLLLNAAAIVGLTAAALVLHAGTLNFYSDQRRVAHPQLRDAFLRAIRNILAIAACSALVYLLWTLLDSTAERQLQVPLYLRSLLPEFIRRHIEPWWFQISFEGIIFAVRWVLIPGLILPLVLEASDSGFRAFSKLGVVALKNSVKRLSYWLILIFAAIAGLVAPSSLLEWTPAFKNSTVHIETISLIARISVAYVLALASWLLVCSLLTRFGRRVAADKDTVRNSAA